MIFTLVPALLETLMLPIMPNFQMPTLEIKGERQRFPVRRLFGVGRNYAAHAREMGGNPERDPPVFFTKLVDGVVSTGGAIVYPPQTKDFHYEIELVVAVGVNGFRLSLEEAQSSIWGYAVGVDLTRRDLQAAARAAGGPWDMAKSFDGCAPCGPLTPVMEAHHRFNGALMRLSVNGAIKQMGNTAEMIWSPAEIVAHLSQTMSVRAGDLIFTGTPSGVGPLFQGDHVEALIEGLEPLSFSIV